MRRTLAMSVETLSGPPLEIRTGRGAVFGPISVQFRLVSLKSALSLLTYCMCP